MAESRRITYYLGLADKLESEQNLSDEELLPEVLLPATTALGTIDSLGREKGISAGANTPGRFFAVL